MYVIIHFSDRINIVLSILFNKCDFNNRIRKQDNFLDHCNLFRSVVDIHILYIHKLFLQHVAVQ